MCVGKKKKIIKQIYVYIYIIINYRKIYACEEKWKMRKKNH